MSDYTPKVGDRVRVSFEGDYEEGGVLIGGGYKLYDRAILREASSVSIEKLEPPVVTFKPGDTVRHKTCRELVYSFNADGYYAHHSAQWFDHESVGTAPGTFTDKFYELVNLGDAS